MGRRASRRASTTAADGERRHRAGDIYPLIILAVLAAAGVVEIGWMADYRMPLMWSLAAFLALGAVMNFVSRSPRERIWGLVALAIAVCCAVIATGV